MQVYPVTMLLMVGFVGGIIALGIITNLIGAAMGPWGSLAKEFPPHEMPDDADRGEASLTLTKKPITEYVRKSRRARPALIIFGWMFWIAFALWLVLAFTGMLSTGMAQGLGMILWVSTFGFYSIFLIWWGWRIVSTPAFPQQIDWVADDDHLHLRRISDVIARYPWISVPWGEVGELSITPDSQHVIFPIGHRWAYTSRTVIDHELRVREAFGAENLSENIESGPITPLPTENRWP